MDTLEDQISRILGDPEQMQKIAGLAQSLMGGGTEPTPEPATQPTASPGLPAGLLQGLGGLMNGGGAPSGREQALLQAMRPYLSEKRRGKLDRAMELARMMRLARLAMEAGGGGPDQPL